MIKRFSALILILAALILSQGSAAAASVYDDALFDITSLGIFVPGEDGGFSENMPLTRAEFATAILRVIGYSETEADSVAALYADVKKDDWYYNCVQAVSQLGLMTGDGEGNFYPQNHVTLREAVKTCVVVLGYGIEAEKQGGWPGGYLAVGTRLRLLDGMNSGDVFLRKDLAVLLYNVIDTQVLSKSYGREEYFKDGNTYRYMLMNIRGENIFNVKGVVTATPYSYTKFPIDNLGNDEVVIDNIRYNIGKTDACKYLGMQVEVYARETAGGIMRLLSVRPTAKNVITTVELNDVVNCGTDEAIYNQGGKNKTVKFEDFPCVLYNGTPIEFDPAEVLNLSAGTVTFIDNDQNSRAEYIFIEAYENMLVQRVAEKVIVPYNGFTVNGKKTLFIDAENENKKYLFFNSDGESVDFSAIEAGNLLSVYCDKEETRIKVYISNQTAQGVLTTVSDDDITVNEKVYKIYSDTVFSGAELGDYVTVYLDHLGKAAYVKYTAAEKNYAWVLKSGLERLSNARVKLLIGKQVSFTADVDAEDADNISSVPVLICENQTIQVFDINKRVKINGENVPSKEAVGLLSNPCAILYSLNSEGLVREIEILDCYGGSDTETLKYNVYDKTFGGKTNITPFALDENTKVICVPTNDVTSDDDYLVRTRVDLEGSNTDGYTVMGYDYNNDTKKAGLLVVKRNMSADYTGTAKIKSSAACMVKKIRAICNDTEDFYRITLIEGGQEVTYDTVKLTAENTVIGRLREGDLISYYMNDSDLIENVLLIRSFADGINMIDKTYADYKEMCGTAEDISFDNVYDAGNYLSTTVICAINGGREPIYIQQRNKPPVFIYEPTGNEKVSAGSLEEIIPGHDRLYVLSLTENGTARACVIVRGE